MFDPVPWFVAGGKHGPEVARLLAHVATANGQGVVQSGDAKVQQLAVPAAAIRVMPGAVAIRNGAAGAASQSYLGRNPEEQEVVLTATSSSGSRSDLIIARIEDPQYPGTADPADPEDGPYIFVRVIEDVPVGTVRVQDLAGHENDSAIALARVTRPASTGTVLNSHITNLRQLVQPRVSHEVRVFNPVEDDVQNFTDSAGEIWPDGASWTVAIPEWATAVRMVGTWAQVFVPAGDAQGWFFIHLYANDIDARTRPVRYDTPSPTNQSRQTYVCADEIPIPAGMRGRTANLYLRAYKSGGADSARIKTDTGSAVSVVLDFLETAV